MLDLLGRLECFLKPPKTPKAVCAKRGKHGTAEMKHEISESTKHLVDVLSVATVLGALVDILPSMAALFTILWTGLRIWETDTVRGWTGRKEQ